MKRKALISLLVLLSIQTLVSAGNLYVPSRDYPTIQSAINAANPATNDVVVVDPGVYSSPGNVDLNFLGKAITVRSRIDPNNPSQTIIDTTIIDCQGDKNQPHRAFYFSGGEDANSKVLGFTIRNGYARGPKGADGAYGYIGDPCSLFRPLISCDDPTQCPPYALNGASASGDGYGGAILCAGASPAIKYCVIKNCTVTGAQGGKGADGLYGIWYHWTLSDFNASGLLPNATMEENSDGQWGGDGGNGIGNGYGGAIACLGSSKPIISECNISDNFARGGCGGDGGAGGDAEYDGSEYDGDESFGGNAGDSIGDGKGGAIYCDGASNPTITNCIFSNNIAATGARGQGGPKGEGDAISVNNGGPATDGADSRVVSSGGIAGGAAYYKYPSDADFINCTFTGNKAYEAYEFYQSYYGEDIAAYAVGGALYSGASNVININTCDFINNMGGAVYCGSSCTLNINNVYDPNRKCLFIGNSDPHDGGDLQIDIGIDFGSGGAIYLGPSTSADIQSCTFSSNSAKNDGGALKSKSDITLKDCSFGGNTAENGYGGAADVYRNQAPVPLKIDANNCSFSGNQAVYGGGLSSEYFDANFIDCYFVGNSALDGGGLDLVNGDLFLTGGAVKGNNATDGDGGGFNCRSIVTEIRNCDISDNSAVGVYPAGGKGGAINFYGWASSQRVFNCLITGNSAAVDGGAIHCSSSAPEVNNCTFDNSFAGGFGGAIFSDWSSQPQITNCIFQNCNGHAIHEEDYGGNAIVKYSLFYDNPDKDYYESSTSTSYDFGSVADPDGNFNGDPLFVTGPLGDYYLSQIAAGQGSDSPAFDSGSDTALNIGLDTFTTRIDNGDDTGQVDRGYHYRKSTGVGMFRLTASVVGGHGSIAVAPVSSDNNYPAGTVVTLTATPDVGWRVKAWSGTDDDSSTAATNTVIMSFDRTVTVEFGQPKTLIVEVGGGQPGYYSNIQDAVADAQDGDVIVVYPGIYYGAYFGTSVYVDKSITIRSLHPDDPCCVTATVIDGYRQSPFQEGYTNYGVAFGPSTDANTIFNGLTIQNCGGYVGDARDGQRTPINHPDGYDGGMGAGSAIQIFGGGPVIKNCILRDNVVIGGNGGGGVSAQGPPENRNAGRGGWGGRGWGGAVYCTSSGTKNCSPTFINCRIINNLAQGGDGGDGGNEVYPGGFANYGGNWSMRGTPEFPAYDIDPYTFNITVVTDADLWELWGYVGDYRWYSGIGGGVFIDEGSNVNFVGCEISGNRAKGGVSGQGGAQAPVPRPVEPLIPYELPSFGGGVYCAADSTVTFTGCTIADNISSEPSDPPVNRLDPYLGHGGGVCAEDTATLVFTGCKFSRNDADAGGGLHFADANAVISDSNFVFNTAFQGGGLFGEHGPAAIRNSTFTGNMAFADEANDTGGVTAGTGGGLHLWAADADIIDCNISSNQAKASGGGVFFGGEGAYLLTNCLLTKNAAGRDGGGVSTDIFSQLNISNCTIADNVVTGLGFEKGYGGGLYLSYNSNTNIINSIIWGNLGNIGAQGSQLAIGTAFEYDPSPSTVNITYSDVQGLTDSNAFGAEVNAIDLVFCIDSTGSMEDDIDAVKAAANQIIGAIEANIPDFRIAVVDYKDFNEDPYGGGADYPYRTVQGFTTNANLVVAAIDSLVASGGGDFPESVYTALMHCIDHNSLAATLGGTLHGGDPDSLGPGAWRHGNVSRVIILMGDAPPHDPEPFTNYTLEDIVAAAEGDRIESKHIVSLVVGGDPEATAYFSSLAAETGGTILQTAGAEGVVGALMDAIDLISIIPDPVFVDANCIFNWDPNNYAWDPCSYNIDENPHFIAGYYLSQIRAGQDVNNPCVDSGSADANDPNIGLGTYTTATNSVPDVNVVDMGYHYRMFIAPYYQLNLIAIEVPVAGKPVVDPNSGSYNQYTVVHLTVNTLPSGYEVLWTGTDNDTLTGTENTVLMDKDKTVTVMFIKNTCDLTTAVIGLGGSILPAGTNTYTRGTVVNLTASPDESYRVKQWTGTDDDESYLVTNTVTMDSDKYVTVEFDTPQVLTVPGDYANIQSAIGAARQYDVVEVTSGTYQGGLIYVDKEITIASTNPDDPCVVASTIIDSSGYASPALAFLTGATQNTVFDGFTIRSGEYNPIDAQNTTEPGQNGFDGYSIGGGAVYIAEGTSPTIKNCIIRDTNITGGNATDGANADATVPAGHGGWAGGSYGGGVFIASNASPTLVNCTVTNCMVRGGNAGNGGNSSGTYPSEDYHDANHGGSWSNDETFPWQSLVGSDGQPYAGDYWYYSGLGGGVFCDEQSSPTFIACNITNNTAVGGMSGIGGTRPWIRPDPVTAYRIPSYGGGVFCAKDSDVRFIDCNIAGNIAPRPDETYHLDPYLGHGGGVAFEDTANIEFINCRIADNNAAVGGGIYWRSGDPQVIDCNIAGNTAYVGGGIYGAKSMGLIQGCFIHDNFAGVSQDDVDTNAVGQGGGIYSTSMESDFIDCVITDNEAAASGGGIFFSGIASTPMVKNCLVVDNLAGRDGGGLSINWYASPLITNCTIIGNEATGDFGEIGDTGLGGGIYTSYHSYSVILNSILWDNFAIQGNELAVGTGFEHDPRPSTVSVSYSDVKGGLAYVFKDTGCTLIWGVGNIQLDPLFVTGPLGSYYLSQTDTGDPCQTTNSPCVDAGNDLAGNVGLSHTYTTRTDDVFDVNTVDMGYHYPLAHPIDLCSFCDLSDDGDVDLIDFALFSLHWLDDDCSSSNGWCGGADITFDSHVNFDDLALINECWLAEDTDAPLPNPSEWEIAPHSTTTTPPHKVSMTAETAYDSWGGVVEYYFECVAGCDSNSGWDPNTTYIYDIEPNITYGYRVKSRDERGHETLWSEIGYAIAGQPLPDHTPPMPNPMTWALFPTAIGPNSITMRATTATDSTLPIEYYFECTSDGDANSNWQTDPNYLAAGLDPDTQYTFMVKARDGAIPHNETGWSDPCSVTTPAQPLPNLPPPNPGWAVIPYEYGVGTDARGHMESNVATDPEGLAVEYYFQCTDRPDVFDGDCVSGGLSSGWQSDTVWDVCLGDSGWGYAFRFKVRDTSPELKESGWSDTYYCYPP